MTARAGILLLTVLMTFHQVAAAQAVHITDQLQVGLHADKTLDSPVVKVVPVGATLELIKQEAAMSFVRESGGASGWLDNSYIAPSVADGLTLQQARDRIRTLETTLAQAPPGGIDTEEITEQLAAEQTRVADLETHITELQNQMGPGGTNRSLYEKIDQLAADKQQLEHRLAAVLEARTDVPPGTGGGLLTFRNLAIALGVTLIIGTGLGIYLMDARNRRRHGGFRV